MIEEILFMRPNFEPLPQGTSRQAGPEIRLKNRRPALSPPGDIGMVAMG